MSVPAEAVAGAVFTIERSAATRTVVVAVAELLVEVGSKVAELLTVAVLEMVVPSGVAGLTWTTMVKLAVAPLATGEVVQLTVPVVPTAGVVQDQPAGAATDW